MASKLGHPGNMFRRAVGSLSLLKRSVLWESKQSTTIGSSLSHSKVSNR